MIFSVMYDREEWNEKYHHTIMASCNNKNVKRKLEWWYKLIEKRKRKRVW